MPRKVQRDLSTSPHMEAFDLRQAARAHCPEAVEVLAKAMKSDDERIRVMAADIMLSRGYGKPPVSIEATTVHKFCVAPEVMDEATWLERRGQPIGSTARKPPDAWHDGNVLDLQVADEPEAAEPEAKPN